MITKDLKLVEAAEMLSMHPTLVRIMCRQGVFPGAYKTGTSKTSRYRIPETDITAYRAQRVAQTIR